jgi:uncharacterized protein YegL
MNMRPGALTGRRPLHFFLLVDCSGSMAADGKMQALNNAVREMLPHLESVSAQNPHAELLVRSIAFSSGARWHVSEPTEPARLRWEDLTAEGYTDLGAALQLLAAELEVPPMPRRALPPAILLVSDGLPTDDSDAGLEQLLETPWGAHAVRTAVAIGRDADLDGLRRFLGSPDAEPLTASNPEQLVRCLRWASVHAGLTASTVATGPAELPETTASTSELIW